MHMKPRQQPIGDKNIIGSKVAAIRKERQIKQKDFLARLQTLGMDISATSLSRLEGQHRLVQDYELVIIAKALEISIDNLLGKGGKEA
jgi:transcriptional regulator with XRE-family HTH domain